MTSYGVVLVRLLKSNYKEVLFWLFYLATILVYIFRPEQYERPIWFFILVALTFGVLALQIVSTKPEKKHIIYTFLKIILVSITIQWSQLMVYPDSFIGTDPWYHETLTSKIISGGQLNRIDYYGTLSFHLLVGNFSILTSLSEKWSMMIVIGLPYTLIISWVIYKLGCLVLTYRVGLMSALVLGTAGLFLYFGIEIIPSTFGMMLVMVVLCLMIQISRHRSKWNILRYFAVIVLLLIILFTNSLMALFIMALLGLFWLALLIYDKFIHRVELSYHPMLIVTVCYFFVVFGWWIFGTGQIGVLLRMIGNEQLLEFFLNFIPYGRQILEEGLLSSTSYFGKGMPDASYWANAFTQLNSNRYYEAMNIIMQYQSSVPIFETIVKRIGILIYGLFGLFGAISITKNLKISRSFSFAVMVVSVVIVVSCIVNVLLSRYFFLSRHIMLSQIILAPMVAYGVFRISDILKSKYIVSICLVILAFTALISPYANIDNRTFTTNSQVRLSFTQEELNEINEICEDWTGKIYTDWYMGYYILHQKPIKPNWVLKDVYDVSECLMFGDYSGLSDDSLVVIRNEVKEYPTLIGDRFYKIDRDIESDLMKSGFGKITDQTVNAYVKIK